MDGKLKVLALSGSTRKDSVNELLMTLIQDIAAAEWEMEEWKGLTLLPYFNQDEDKTEPPVIVQTFRDKISAADGVLICTPEYVFSLPGVLKNAIEWTVSTTVFSQKPVALITASSSGEKAHESLLLIFRTIYAMVEPAATLLISGAKAKIKESRELSDPDVLKRMQSLVTHFSNIMHSKRSIDPKAE